MDEGVLYGKNLFLLTFHPKNGSCVVMRGSQLLVGETGLSGESLRRCELDVGLSW